MSESAETPSQSPSPPPPPPPAECKDVVVALSLEEVPPVPLVRQSSMLATRTIPPRNKTIVKKPESSVPAPQHLPRRPVALNFPRKIPIISPSAQAVLPIGPFIRSAQIPSSSFSSEARRVCNGDRSESILDYLDFCRRLTGSTMFPAKVIPLEEDEEALEFLYQSANGKPDQAKLLLLSSLYGNKNQQQPETTETAKNEIDAEKFTAWKVKSEQIQSSQPISAVELSLAIQTGREFNLESNQLLVELETLYAQVEPFVSKLHGAILLRSRNLDELQDLASSAPSGFLFGEVDVLRGIIETGRAWECQVKTVLQSSDLTTLNTLLMQGERSVVNHSSVLFELRSTIRNLQSCEQEKEKVWNELSRRMLLPTSTTAVVGTEISSRKRRGKPSSVATPPTELSTLDDLLALQEKMCKLKLPPNPLLEERIQAAQKWITQVNDTIKTGSVKDLVALQKECESLAVNVFAEKQKLDEFVSQAQEFFKRARLCLQSKQPRSSSSNNNKLSELQKDSSFFLRLRVEMEQLGLDSFAEAQTLKTSLIQIVSWVENVRASDMDLPVGISAESLDFQVLAAQKAALTKLLMEHDNELPVTVEPEISQLKGAIDRFAWLERTVEVLSSPVPLPLKDFEELLFKQNSPPRKDSTKKMKFDSHVTLEEWEKKVNQVVMESKAWLHALDMIVSPKEGTYMKYDDFFIFLKAKPVRVQFPQEVKLRRKIEEMVEIQISVRDRLIPLLESHPLYFIDLKAAPLFMERFFFEGHYPVSEQRISVTELEEMQSAMQAMGVETPELLVLHHILDQYTRFQNKCKEVFPPPIAGQKRHRKDVLYHTFNESELLALEQTGTALVVVDVAAQLKEIRTCLTASLEWRQMLEPSWLRVEKFLQPEKVLLPSTQCCPQSSNLLHRMGLATMDETFPQGDLPQVDCSLDLLFRDAMDALKRDMQRAFEKELHLAALCDSPVILHSAWAIKASLYLDVLQSKAESKESIKVISGLILEGMKLLKREVILTGMDTLPNLHDKRWLPCGVASSTPIADSYAVDDSSWKVLLHVKPIYPEYHNVLTRKISQGLDRLRFLSQHWFASRNLCKLTVSKTNREKKTIPLLRTVLEKCTLPYIMESSEEMKLRLDLGSSESWMKEMESKRLSLEAIPKMISKGEKLWVGADVLQVWKDRVQLGNAWSKKVKEAFSSMAPISELKLLLAEGRQDFFSSVDLNPLISKLADAVDVMCMCRAQRQNSADAETMSCEDCLEVFHRECIREFYSTLCPCCQAMRRVHQLVGEGYAAICRVKILSMMGPTTDAKIQLLISFVQEAELVLQTPSLNSVLARLQHPTPPAEISQCAEVCAIVNAIQAKFWGCQLDRLRHRPSFEDLESTMRCMPAKIGSASQGLINIVNRGKILMDSVSQIWALPVHTSSSSIVTRCKDVMDTSRWLPMELTQMVRGINACLEDGAKRYCFCGKFFDGKLMVSCKGCDQWFHGECVGYNQTSETEHYYCVHCELEQ